MIRKRADMPGNIMYLYNKGVINDSDLEEFSEEFQKFIKGLMAFFNLVNIDIKNL